MKLGRQTSLIVKFLRTFVCNHGSWQVRVQQGLQLLPGEWLQGAHHHAAQLLRHGRPQAGGGQPGQHAGAGPRVTCHVSRVTCHDITAAGDHQGAERVPVLQVRVSSAVILIVIVILCEHCQK